jgi:potassium voltage-gated channel Eag-related subfamily H protein 8
MQCNVDGLTAPKLAELQACNADIIVVQETKLRNISRAPALIGYSAVRKDRPTPRQAGKEPRGGGLCTFVKNGIAFVTDNNFRPTSLRDNTTEYQSIRLQTVSGDLRIVNIYKPPIRTSQKDNRTDHFNPALLPNEKHTVICGDFNCHHSSWDPFLDEDSIGEELSGWIDSADKMLLLNDGSATRRSRSTGAESVPDVTIASSDLDATWKAQSAIGSSDHHSLWIQIEVAKGVAIAEPREQRPNFKKADWQEFTAAITTTEDDSLTTFVSNIKLATEQHIPMSKPCRRDAQPWFDKECKQAIKERNLAFKRSHISVECREEWTAKSQAADSTCYEKKRAWWKVIASEFDMHTDPGRIHACIRGISGRGKKSTPEEGITLISGRVVHGQKKATAYAKLYASWSRIKNSTIMKERRTIKLSNTRELAARIKLETDPDPVTLLELEQALQKCSTGTAAGPDGIYFEQLNHLPSPAVTCLRNIITQSFCSGKVPRSWRQATVIPILKPGKSASKLDSYRPISLTSTIAKLAERVLLNRISHTMDTRLSPEQAGFRPHRSCEDQIAGLAQSIYDASECIGRKRTALACFDFAKAFDTVPRHRLDRSILQSGIPAYAVRFFHEFLADRRVQVKFGGKSGWMKVTNGLPQGTVTSPILFTTFIDPLIKAARNNDTQVSVCR